ncbi:MAG: hypothetical protein HOE72_07830 [Candidatus Marinimicrobia bacterium]|nr:hypothetical protein [Candidatus Neomarinimicrobiota bacterium]MBT5385904.1 hypothetical protein [Candidatus Neomarinimicrobiota bacterium]MBT5776952.1 hypothetical protein [Candidatus Neomarinimicrobiota bacterium]MBT6391064.1 hypothetical protein [Candidatus Neomarinimicrobiota bacterium]
MGSIFISIFSNQFENMILQTTGMLISNLFLTFIRSLSAGFIAAIVASNNHERIVQIAATVNLVFAIGI